MSYKILTNHSGKMAFDTLIGGHSVRMDTIAEQGGEDSGPSPKKLLLGTLAVCTGMDVVSLLNKMRVVFSDFSILTTAELTDEHPKVFSTISITYRIKTDERYHSKMEKAVNLSQEKYCGISEMLKKNNPINFNIEYL